MKVLKIKNINLMKKINEKDLEYSNLEANFDKLEKKVDALIRENEKLMNFYTKHSKNKSLKSSIVKILIIIES